MLLVVLDEGEHRLGVVEDVPALGGGVRRIEADDDGADGHDCPVEQEPLEPRPAEDGDRVSPADAAGQERPAERVDPPCGLVPGDVAPAVRLFLEIGGGRAALLEHVAPEGRRSAGFERHSGHRKSKEMLDPTRIRSIP